MKYKQLRLLMRLLKILVALVILILIICLLSGNIVKGITYLKKEHVLNSVITGACTVISAVIAIIGVHFTINNSRKLKNQELLNELDQKSEWRKELMNIAAKPVIQLEDVYRILASLRFLPKSEDEIKESNQPKFDEISNYIYKHLNEMLNDTLKKVETKNTLNEKGIKIQMSIKESEEIRLYTKFLLKHHWEYNKGEEDKEKFKKKELNEFRKVIKEIKRLNENPIISNVYYKTKVHIGELEEN